MERTLVITITDDDSNCSVERVLAATENTVKGMGWKVEESSVQNPENTND